MKMPMGGRPTIAITPSDQAPAQDRVRNGEAPNLGHLLRALDLRDVSDGKEDRGLGQASA